MNRMMVCSECKGSKPLVRYLREESIPVRTLGCQKICTEPVAGCVVRGRIEWFSGIRTKKQYRALAELARGAKTVPSELHKRRVEKRSGRGPR